MDNTNDCVRTKAEIDDALLLAKLDKNELLPSSQMVYFASTNVFSKNYKLLQLDNHLLSTLEKGESLYIRGQDDDNAVLCTDMCTYNLLETETSNSLLAVKDLNFFEGACDKLGCSSIKVDVFSIFNDYLEPVLSMPRLSKIREVLNKTIYRGPELECDVNECDLCSFDDLLQKAQTSELELRNILNAMPVVTINGKIRLLEQEYHFRVLSYMLKLIEENSWLLDEIVYEDTIDSLSDIVPKEILTSLFEKYTVESKVIDGVQLYKYKEEEVCRFFAQILLLHAGKFNLNEFLQAWQESVPEGMIPKEEMLYGISVINKKSNPPSIRAFAEEDLPENIHERFKILFDVKEKWTVPEITPYVRSLTSPKLDVTALLAKYARVSTVNGTKYYSAKHAK
ncbi:sister chromatid cohesion protein DCC1-like [Agrilus planipennis]|uniref:Sister chromatid cohesion protein DCC1 n=1 Tax=Agrilus planipennis TaxID=224129 RepID=A0A1W4XMU9_AGRPL|nr:sister chromatid cohesion protein DCC1 [Agrilus planipennis]XP_025833395.1 sister chromatid cohesion protein DCC1-like [Agrilus planipennis]